ncbi:hypothetical protein BJF96_g7336 [Verticillium dahliae]|uniref:Uncharacterized protein n=1 Tax=Verticillium dahliae TaxID=27337 RepID=A0AA44WCV0_VERDA|nr:hypothetical protein BJF96_g7336 [Verticillium dahliae]
MPRRLLVVVQSFTKSIIDTKAERLEASPSPVSLSANNDNTNRTVGIVLGVLLGVFVIGVCIFLYVYRDALRKARHRRRRRRRHHRRPGSKSSKSSSEGAPPPSPPAPPADAAPAPAAA